MKVRTCAECPWFACEDLLARIPGKDFCKKIETRINAKIPKKDYLSFIKPYEGIEHLRKIRKSMRKDKIVKKQKVLPLKAKVVAFPVTFRISRSKMLAFEKLYEILTYIITSPAKTYARQIVMKRRKPHLFSLLWAFGLYGKFEKGKHPHLIIDSKTHGSRPQISYFVRKRDNTLYSTFVHCFRIMKSFGAKGEFVRVNKKDWVLKLSFNKKAGGGSTLKALKLYIRTLAKKYGEPKYRGSSQLKGKAYSYFTKADMRILSR
jgi:hypothetical protein